MSQGKYTHISFEERVVIENRLKSGESLRRILSAHFASRTLESTSTISFNRYIGVKQVYPHVFRIIR